MLTSNVIKQRSRKFTPDSFFKAIIHLIAGTNSEGYLQALIKTFDLKALPTKASLSKARKRISWTFFKDALFDLLSSIDKRCTYKGLYIYATDGLQLHLPRTDNIIKAGYNGRATSKYSESYTPRLYVVHMYDVISKTTFDFIESSESDEIKPAAKMIANLEKNSVTIYDRLYISKRIILAHKKAVNCFLFRARKSSFKVIRNFYKVRSKTDIVRECVIEGVKVRLIKVKNPKTKKREIFVTNLPESFCNPKEIEKLYQLRWEVEESFKDLTSKLKVEQWHSKTINGIRQELYAAFWLMNFTRIQILKTTRKRKVEIPKTYRIGNFKLVLNFVIDHLKDFFKGKRGLIGCIKKLLKISTEKRTRMKRSYKRQLKGPASPYPRNNTVWSVPL